MIELYNSLNLVTGTWGQWSSYSECSQTCGGGSKTRRRKCSNPSQHGIVSICVGPAEETVMCGTEPCKG